MTEPLPQVDFYLLTASDPTERLRFACRVTEKAYQRGHRVQVRLDSDEALQRFDQLLWTFRPASFVPHERCTDGTQPTSPVCLGRLDTVLPGDVLVNVTDRLPPDWWTGVSRITEILTDDPECRAGGRARYRAYRDAGAQVTSHAMGSG